jgi:tripartite ATP-independent transporter DctM subunit
MTWWIALGGGIGLLLVLLALGVPVFVAFLLLNLAGVLALFGSAGFGLFANSIYNTATTGALTAVPLFIVMGEILFRSGAMEVLFDSLDRLVGRIRGRQYVVCILLSAILGALSGAAIAVAGLLGRSLFPAMRRRGYDTEFSAGTMLAGASLDPIIPPSVLAVLVAITAEVSVGKMLIAGIGPGLLLTSLFLAYVLLRVRANPKLAPDLAAELAGGAAGSALGATRSALGALARMVPPLFVFFMVMGLIMLGVATPTEAAATGVLGALAVALYYGRLGWPMVRDALAAAATVAALLLAIMCSAVMFSQLLTVTGAAAALAELVTGVRPAAWLMVFILLAVPFVLFMFLDQLAIMLMIVPIYQPILKLYGFDGIWFWTLFLITVTAGGLTPPFGYILFALKSAAPDVPMRTIYRASWPFVRILVLGLVLCALFPGIVTYLPGLSR